MKEILLPTQKVLWSLSLIFNAWKMNRKTLQVSLSHPWRKKKTRDWVGTFESKMKLLYNEKEVRFTVERLVLESFEINPMIS